MPTFDKFPSYNPNKIQVECNPITHTEIFLSTLHYFSDIPETYVQSYVGSWLSRVLLPSINQKVSLPITMRTLCWNPLLKSENWMVYQLLQ